MTGHHGRICPSREEWRQCLPQQHERNDQESAKPRSRGAGDSVQSVSTEADCERMEMLPAWSTARTPRRTDSFHSRPRAAVILRVGLSPVGSWVRNDVCCNNDSSSGCVLFQKKPHTRREGPAHIATPPHSPDADLSPTCTGGTWHIKSRAYTLFLGSIAIFTWGRTRP